MIKWNTNKYIWYYQIPTLIIREVIICRFYKMMDCWIKPDVRESIYLEIQNIHEIFISKRVLRKTERNHLFHSFQYLCLCSYIIPSIPSHINDGSKLATNRCNCATKIYQGLFFFISKILVLLKLSQMQYKLRSLISYNILWHLLPVENNNSLIEC